jgi:hypothetical protein
MKHAVVNANVNVKYLGLGSLPEKEGICAGQ